jgi:3-hydroxybutyryl-CoA dehydrogenase
MTNIKTIAVIGAGYMGGGIAQALALANYDVRLADVDEATAQAALNRLLQEARDFESQGLFPAGSAATIAQHLTAAASIEAAVKDADFIEEVVAENVDIKRDVLARISNAARPDAIIGTNTSTIPVHQLVSAITAPERFLTVHFSNPAPFIPGVELVCGPQTSEETVATVKDLLKSAGREGAQVADTPGMVLNRLQFTLFKEAASIVEEGIATPEDVDAIVRSTFGFRLGFFGPFAIADQAGLDVYLGAFSTLEQAYGERLSAPKILRETVESGQKGVKTGAGLTGKFDDSTSRDLIAYRNNAYAKMNQLVQDLGPAPKGN